MVTSVIFWLNDFSSDIQSWKDLSNYSKSNQYLISVNKGGWFSSYIDNQVDHSNRGGGVDYKLEDWRPHYPHLCAF